MKSQLFAFFLGSSIALLAACTEAGRCERGEPGCTPRESGTRCVRGATFDEDRNLCVADASSGSGGSDGGGSGSGGDPEPIECPDDTAEEACQVFCEAYCQNQERLCVESRCEPGDCDPDGDLVKECVEECDEEADCARELCLTQVDVECEEFGFTQPIELEDDMRATSFVSLCALDDPRCVPGSNVGCSDLCGTSGDGVGGQLVDNGVCEDGGEGSISPDSPPCNRGTDCTDCGVRLCAMPGEDCAGHGDCCGFYENDAFCVELSTGPTCLTTCTETRSCEDGLRCLAVDDEQNRVCAP